MVVAIVVVAGGLLVLAIAMSYNRFIEQRQLIANSWSNVDTELKRRHDLIPNLVETVKGYVAHERGALEAVITARANAVAVQGSAAGTQQPAQHVLVDGLRQLLAVSEAYPELKASLHFLQLQDELVTTENRIQAARRFYNGNIRDYNRRVDSFPSLLIARLAGFRRADYFEVEPAIRELPRVTSS